MNQPHYYTDEKNAQIVIALLKAHGIRKMIASPGTSNLSVVGSAQFDDWFEIYSAIDERHAAYMACGLAEESGEPVVICCTGATASRNYIPGLTEAYYRKLPILAITAAQPSSHIGNLWGQCLDRSVVGKDIVKYSVHLQIVKSDEDFKDCQLRVNRAILELARHGGGPVHINLETVVDGSFSTKELPQTTRISRYFTWSKNWPIIDTSSRVSVLIGSHPNFTPELTGAISRFVDAHNAVVLNVAPRTYNGKNRIAPSLVCSQHGIGASPLSERISPDLVIYIGEVFNDYTFNAWFFGKAEVWRVSEDGEIRDRYGHLTNVFEMDEKTFFDHYSTGDGSDRFYRTWCEADRSVREKSDAEMPFANPVVARTVLARFPDDAVLHLGVSSTYQHWNMFLHNGTFPVYANVGCCGIDGCVSSMIGGSLASPHKLHVGIFGDLTFFYDLNSIGNRHIGKNIRILLINNGLGALFHHPGHVLDRFGEERKVFFGAEGHFGNKSPNLVKHMAEDLGFVYRAVRSEKELEDQIPLIFSKECETPILIECFTDVEDERIAWGIRTHLDAYEEPLPCRTISGGIKRLVPQRIKNAVKELIK